ncbi:unnamed protein product [Mytilus edulis]|uniref:WSC domain-containing protein n=1 Tax=Mytilus edulis TaxID=6550 RepID=A0A8S3QTR7_MYTED|nr:unnamed protein product [Mytilus edulis]
MDCFWCQIWISFILTKSVYMETNLTEILCEQQVVNLTCDEGTRINISEVNFGKKEDDLSLDTTLSRYANNMREIVRLLCNSHNTCHIDNSLNNFTGFLSPVPRKVGFTYRCEFEYYGCFADKSNFDLHDHGFLQRTNMSAKICYKECSKGNVTRQYFATEDGSHCVCGGIIGLSTLKQRKQKENKCETPCMSNENEMCGSKNRASVYVVKTEESNHPIGSVHSINGITSSYNSNTIKSVSVGPFYSVNARIIGGVIGAVILIVFLTLCLFKKTQIRRNKSKDVTPFNKMVIIFMISPAIDRKMSGNVQITISHR